MILPDTFMPRTLLRKLTCQTMRYSLFNLATFFSSSYLFIYCYFFINNEVYFCNLKRILDAKKVYYGEPLIINTVVCHPTPLILG